MSVTVPAAPAGQKVYAGWLTGGPRVILQSWDTLTTVAAILDSDGAKITAGFGKWDQVAIPRGDPFTQWTGRALVEMTLAIIFDGWGVTLRSVESDIATLEALATKQGGATSPAQLRIWGPVPRAGLSWVITGLDYGDVIRDTGSGARVRQAMVVHLMEYRAETQVAQMPRAAAQPKPPQKYKVKKGDTLKTIAAKQLGSSGKWQLIAKANKGLRGIPIPKSFIGKTIKIPAK